MKPKSSLRAFLLASSSLLLAAASLHAADGSWLGTSGDWSNTGIWSGGTIADGTDSTAFFTGVNITAAQTINLDAARTIGNVTFTDDTTASHDLTISGANILTLDVTTGSPVINVTQSGRSLTINSVIDGADGLTKDGAGILALGTANTYTGDTVISAGTLRIGNNTAGTLGGGNYAGNISIAGGATLAIWSTASQTLSGVISGDGSLTKAYGGALVLSGDNTYTGKTTIAPQTTAGSTVTVSSFNSVNGGTPLLASSSLGAPTTVANGTIQLGDGGKQASCTLLYNGAGETTDRVINVQFNGSASQTINASGTGLLRFTSAMTSNGGTQTGGLNLDGTGSGEITQGLPALANGGLRKNGTGTWALGGTNTYNKPTSVNKGTLIFQGAQAVSPNSAITLDHTSGNSGAIKLLDDTSGTIALPNTLNIRTNNSTGSHGIFVGNNNTANGGSSSGATTGSTFEIADLVFSYAKSDTQYQSVNTTGADGYGIQFTNVVLNNLNLRAAGSTTESRFNPTSASITLGAVTMAAGNAMKGVPVLVLTGTTSGNEVTGIISDATDALTTGRPLSLTKNGTSTWTLSGANAYTGATTVSAGTLTIATGGSTHASSAVTVSGTSSLVVNGTVNGSLLANSSTTLSGIGTIVGDATIQGTHNPGNSPGIQTFGNLSYTGGASVVNWELSANTVGNLPNPNALFDQTVVTGDLDFANLTTLNLIFNGAGSGVLWSDSFWGSSRSWVLYDVSGTTSNFSNLSLTAIDWLDSGSNAFDTVLSGSSFSLSQIGNDVLLSYTIPEPLTAFLGTLGLLALLRRRR